MLIDQEKREIREKVSKASGEWHFDLMLFATEIERAVLAKAGEQEPIYMWRLEDDGWMECTKEWFDSHMVEGYEKRIVYAHPLPSQAIPDKIGTDSVISSIYKKGWNDCIDVILSASPKP